MGEAFERLCNDAEMVGWHVAVFIDPSTDPRSKRSKLAGVALLDAERHPVRRASLLHDDRLDVAAVGLADVLAKHRGTR